MPPNIKKKKNTPTIKVAAKDMRDIHVEGSDLTPTGVCITHRSERTGHTIVFTDRHKAAAALHKALLPVVLRVSDDQGIVTQHVKSAGVAYEIQDATILTYLPPLNTN